MSSTRLLVLSLMCLIVVPGSLFTLPRNAEAQPVRRLETGYVRDVNRYRWTAAAEFSDNVAGWDARVRDFFSSDAFVLFGNRVSFRDENQLLWLFSRPFNQRITASIHGRSAWFSQSRVLSQDMYAGVLVSPYRSAQAEPFVGLAWDQRPGAAISDGLTPLRTDVGPAYGMRLALTPPPLQDYRLTFYADGNRQLINPRRGHAVHIAGSAEKTFENTRIGATVAYANLRRDAYQSISFLNRDTQTNSLSETIEATTSDTLLASLTLDAPVYRRLHLTSRLDLGLTNRFVRIRQAPADALFFDTDFNRRALDAEVALAYEDARLTSRLAVVSGAELERRRLANRDDLPPTQAAQKGNTLQQADYDRGHLSVLAQMRALFSPRVALTFDATASILRHDTPAMNSDDRDEAYQSAQLGLLLKLNRYVQMDLNLFGTSYHTVYLGADRSGENNVQRSLRLRPGIQWMPSSYTRIRFGSEVRATYTVDDFTLPGRRPKDQSARELRYEVESEHTLEGGSRLLAGGSVSNLFLGRLLWNQFAEIPSDTLRTYSGWIHVQSGKRIVADVGFRFFIRSDFDRAVTVRYDLVGADEAPLRDASGEPLTGSISRPGRAWIAQMGPTCAIIWPMQHNSRIRLDGWLNVQRVSQHLYGSLPEAAADRIRQSARRGTRTIIPNVSLSVLWNL